MEPVTQQDMRAALRGAASPRRVPAVVSAAPEPAWDWETGLSQAERGELEDLRGLVERLTAEADTARTEARSARRRAAELDDALRQLAGAKPWQRRRVRAALSQRGML